MDQALASGIARIAIMTIAAAALYAGGVSAEPPSAPIEPVTDDYFGVKVTDPYRWMEERNAPRFVEWLTAQNAHTRTVLDRIGGRSALEKRIAAHTAGGTVIQRVRLAGSYVFYEKRRPGENTFKLYVRRGVDGKERLLVDPDRRATATTHFAIDYYAPSMDGRQVAYGISPGGSEESVIHVLDVSSGRESTDTIDRAQYGFPSWRADGNSFFYNRFAPRSPGDKETDKYLNSRAYLHIVGTDPATDAPLIGTGLQGSVAVTPVDVPIVSTSAGSKFAVALIYHGADPAVTLYVAPLAEVSGANVPWRRVADVADAVSDFAIQGDRLFLLSHKDAPRYKVLEVDAREPDLANARTVVPSSERVIRQIAVTSDALYVQDLDGGLSRMRRYGLKTSALREVALPATGTINGPITSPARPEVLFGLQGWVLPERWYRIGPEGIGRTSLVPEWRESTAAYIAEEVKVSAPDGVSIPLSIVHKRGLPLNRSNPVWLTGYGAYGFAFMPAFSPRFLTLLEDGGVFAVAHVRGGGEYGEEWHEAGRKATKPNTYKDLIACAEYLIQHGYASAGTVGISGGSAGGITVGMAMTERPDLFRVVISDVGDSNALRAEFETDGPANALEYGSVGTEAGFRALLAVDALHHVRDGTAYPAVLLTTGINDPRVAPWQAGKMAARLQAATSSGRPVLLRVDFDAGHGMGSTKAQRDALFADQLAFLYWQLGLPGYKLNGATSP
jgi:prolyl oligopeptidase